MWFRVRVSHPPSHVTHWSCDHVILKIALSLPSLGQWPPILARCDLSWVDHSHRVTRLVYHVITLYSQKGASPVSQRQWPSNLVRLWVWVKGPALTLSSNLSINRSRDFFTIYLQTQCHRTQLENIEKLTNQYLFFLFERY